jgi:membrane protein YdbS with pleckstrin-like domain
MLNPGDGPREGLPDPDATAWQPVSEKLVKLRLVCDTIWFVPLVLVWLILGLALQRWWLLLITVAIAPLWFPLIRLVRRRVVAIGYLERESDLVIRRGVMIRKLTVIPYGRLQFIDLLAGPLARRYGLTSLRLATAAPDLGASLPGLSAEDAAGLRDRLAQRCDAKMVGL